MSTFYTCKCEICPNNFSMPSAGLARPYEYTMPDGWFTFYQGNPRHTEAYHFCSRACLAQWVGAPTQEQLLMPTSTMRRFLLIDGETADEIEGIKWGDGSVNIKPLSDHCVELLHCTGFFRSWQDFKLGHPGCGITWIDQEASDAANS